MWVGGVVLESHLRLRPAPRVLQVAVGTVCAWRAAATHTVALRGSSAAAVTGCGLWFSPDPASGEVLAARLWGGWGRGTGLPFLQVAFWALFLRLCRCLQGSCRERLREGRPFPPV